MMQLHLKPDLILTMPEQDPDRRIQQLNSHPPASKMKRKPYHIPFGTPVAYELSLKWTEK